MMGPGACPWAQGWIVGGDDAPVHAVCRWRHGGWFSQVAFGLDLARWLPAMYRKTRNRHLWVHATGPSFATL